MDLGKTDVFTQLTAIKFLIYIKLTQPLADGRYVRRYHTEHHMISQTKSVATHCSDNPPNRFFLISAK